MTDSPAQIVQALCNRDSEFAGTYQAYRSQLQNWAANGVLPTSHITGKRILDWECGRGVFTALLLEQGAAAVTAIDSWLVDSAYIQKNLNGLPGASFERISLEQFAVDEQHHGAYDLIFANTVTEHMLNLPPLLAICYQLLAVDGELVINHGNYYEPVGSHDHGFLFYGENNEIVFQGPRCWESTTKCAASADFRRSIRERLSWTWGDWNESQLTPDNCIYCPYYRRAQPWAHLLYQQEFRQVFPQQCFTTGYPGSGLNKITPFQLRQFLIEAGFNIELWVPIYINNHPPQELLRPPFNFSIEDLCTAMIAVRCSKAALPGPLHWTSAQATSSSPATSSS
jgi:2-polyprenyl-6-hydroxyphenyl methylase/3-demethylubiquinone-9 3-methyltransferase